MPDVKTKPLVTVLAGLMAARKNCEESGNDEWLDRHTRRAEDLAKEHLPSGSGFDSDTTLDLATSTSEKLVFNTSFHHMNDVGMYDGWTEHKVTVRASLAFGFTLSINITASTAHTLTPEDHLNAIKAGEYHAHVIETCPNLKTARLYLKHAKYI